VEIVKIDLVSEHASPLAALGGADAGGQNVYVDQLSSALVRRGHDVTVYTRRDAEDLAEELVARSGYRVVHVPAGPPGRLPKDELLPHMAEFGRYLGQRWQDERPDVIHTNFWMSGVAALHAVDGHAIDSPIVHTFHALGTVKKRHQGDRDTSPPDRIRLERLLGQRATHIAATCSNEGFELARMGVAPARISVVPCGVDLDLFRPDGPRAPRHAPWRLVAVGRLVERKGFGLAVRSLRSLPDTELVVAGGPADGPVGDDPEARRLLRLAEREGVADRVWTPGLVSRGELPALLRSADAVVCTPDYEPFGIVPVESMACGVPVIGAAVGGLTDTVVDGVTGLLVPPGDADAVAAAAARLLDDGPLRERLGAAGSLRVRTRYSWDRVGRDILSVYQRARAGGRDTAGGRVAR
jgi:glycosyltransferase involved in cell wall biosynthesis